MRPLMLALALVAALAMPALAAPAPQPTPPPGPVYLGPVQAGQQLYPLLMDPATGRTFIDARFTLVPVPAATAAAKPRR